METGYDKMNRMESENNDSSGTKKIAEYLSKHNIINPIDALTRCGVYRLSARIYELRHDYGWQIECMQCKVRGKKHSQYRLIKAGKDVV